MTESNNGSYRERLRRLVETVQEVKSENEYLIGSQDVWNLLKERKSVCELPIRSAKSINQGLEAQFSKIIYKSTPERLNGLNEFFESDGMYDGSSPRGLMALSGIKLFDDNSIVDIDVTESYRSIFVNANRAQITFDDELGGIVAATIQESYDEKRSKLDKKNLEECDGYVRKKMDESKAFDWVKGCSLEEYSSFERSHLKSLADGEIYFVEMIERAQNELVDHRLHTKRAILSNYLSREGGFIGQLGKVFGFSPTWESIKLECEFNMRSISDDLKNPGRPHREMKELNISEDKIIDVMKGKRRTLNALKYLRQIIGSERSWIEKVLRD